jgi:hypothetical protein
MSSSSDYDVKRFLLLLQEGITVDNLEVVRTTMPVTSKVEQSIIDRNMEVAYPNYGTHDWGPFGEYEYLGAGTPYTQKSEAGIKPRNDLDRIAMMHDSQYQMTGDRNYAPGLGLMKSGERGLYDYGAGAAMMTAAFNPWSDLTFKDRILAFAAGESLMIQGAIRLSPATWIVGVGLDLIFY